MVFRGRPSGQVRTYNPVYAYVLGINKAMVIAQLNYLLVISKNVRNGFTWTYQTYEEWHHFMPYLSARTIRRTLNELEDDGIVVTGNFNQMKNDHTKWYRLNPDKLDEIDKSDKAQEALGMMYQNIQWNSNTPKDQVIGGTTEKATTSYQTSLLADPSNDDEQRAKRNKQLLKQAEEKRKKSAKHKKQLEQVKEVVEYLNKKCDKHYRPDAKINKTPIIERLNNDYTVEMLKRIIDNMYSRWYKDEKMDIYLRPSTLFGNKADNYLNMGTRRNTYQNAVDKMYSNISFNTNLGNTDGPF